MSDPQERRRLIRAKYQIPTPALFLDRDGVLIEDKHHLCDPTEVSLCPGSKELVQSSTPKELGRCCNHQPVRNRQGATSTGLDYECVN